MQRVEDKQSGCVGVKFLTETVLKLQNAIVNKKVTIKKNFSKENLFRQYTQTYFV